MKQHFSNFLFFWCLLISWPMIKNWGFCLYIEDKTKDHVKSEWYKDHRPWLPLCCMLKYRILLNNLLISGSWSMFYRAVFSHSNFDFAYFFSCSCAENIRTHTQWLSMATSLVIVSPLSTIQPLWGQLWCHSLHMWLFYHCIYIQPLKQKWTL